MANTMNTNPNISLEYCFCFLLYLLLASLVCPVLKIDHIWKQTFIISLRW